MEIPKRMATPSMTATCGSSRTTAFSRTRIGDAAASAAGIATLPVNLASRGRKPEADARILSVAMGVPDFAPAALPFVAEREAPSYHLDLPSGPVEFGAVSIGNPHAVIRVRSVDDAPVDSVGPAMENHARFPRRVNVGFLEIVAPDHVETVAGVCARWGLPCAVIGRVTADGDIAVV